MTQIIARVIQTTGSPRDRVEWPDTVPASGTLVAVDQQCGGCRRCVHQKTEAFFVAGHFSGEVSLEMSVQDQCFALFHSLLMPLLFGLSFALIADWLQLAEFYGIIFAVCGFTLGVWLCRKLHQSALRVNENC